MIVKLAETNHKSDVKLPIMKKAVEKVPMEFLNQEVLNDMQIKPYTSIKGYSSYFGLFD